MPDEHLNKTAVKINNIYNTTCTLRIIIYLYIIKKYAHVLHVKPWLRMTLRTTITRILLAFLWPRPLMCALIHFYHDDTIFPCYSMKRGKNLFISVICYFIFHHQTILSWFKNLIQVWWATLKETGHKKCFVFMECPCHSHVKFSH